jgi:hypothetical protein
MKVYGITEFGVKWHSFYKTKKIAKSHLLRYQPTCKKQVSRSKLSGCEVYDNSEGQTYCIIEIKIITKEFKKKYD